MSSVQSVVGSEGVGSTTRVDDRNGHGSECEFRWTPCSSQPARYRPGRVEW
ncbi:hypothetical protein ACFSEO_10515 [Agromyces cerinus subsp. nitratus]|uniref:hypothetical protein n=1 Tax=Agromyces cerinus TaxID=33878 RepID=UPI003629D852